MNLKAQTTPGAELKYEIDALYVSTEMILSGRFREYPLDSFLLETCLLHFRIVWDFFYSPGKKPTDITAANFITNTNWTPPVAPARLKDIRSKNKWIDVMLAHLTTHRSDPDYKMGEVMGADIQMIRDHTKTLFDAFVKCLTDSQRAELVNHLAHKFTQYETLKP